MRAYAHIVAIVLALTLIAKPCASALAAMHAAGDVPLRATQLAQPVQDQAIILKNKKKCTSSCLKGRIEKFNWRGVVHKHPHAAAHSAVTSVSAPYSERWDMRQAGSRASTNPHVQCRAVRKVLSELCRQLI